MSNYPRNHAMDFIRSTAMIAGIFFHASLAYLIEPLSLWPVRDYTPGTGLIDFFVWFSHRLRMPLFYFVSGFFTVLLLQKYSLKEFLKKRITRILLPFLFGILVIIPISIEAFRYNGFSPSLTNIFEYKSFFHLWFLFYLSLIYILFLSSQRLFLFLENIKLTSLFLFQVLLSCFFHYLMDDMTSINKTSQFSIDFIALFYYFSFFLYGAIFFKRKNELLTKIKMKTMLAMNLILSITIPALLQTGKQFLSLSSLKFTVDTLTGLFVISGIYLSLLLTHKYLTKERKSLRYLSDSSYWLYLWHIPLVVSLQYILKPLPLPSEVKIIINTSFTCFILLITYHFFVRFTFIGDILHGKRTRV